VVEKGYKVFAAILELLETLWNWFWRRLLKQSD
jgi:hypothetical protein